MIGQTVSHYKIVEKLGGGGMGVVYKAEDTKLGRYVALKFLPEEVARDRQTVERFMNEARAAAALSHPHICTIHEIDEHEGVPFIAMEFLEGRNLKFAIASKPMAAELVVELGIQIAEALAAAHAKGITHRDVKPSNVFLTQGGQVKVVDFGLAKIAPQSTNASEEETIVADAPTQTADLTESGSTMGTVAYMSPEQALGQELDSRSDLFSLGAVLYEMITGRQAFAGSTQAAIFDKILNRQPPSPTLLQLEIPYELEQIVNKALDKNKLLRYQSALEIHTDLRRVRRDIESGRSAAVQAADESMLEGQHVSGAVQIPTPPTGSAAIPMHGSGMAPAQTPMSGSAPAMVSGSAQAEVASGSAVVYVDRPHTKRALWIMGALLLATILTIGMLLWQGRSGPALGETDVLLLTDVVNNTGDPVFDGTLKQALAVKLEESPYLRLLPERQVQDTLQLMQRSANERITPQIGQEICERQGIKAMVTGEIAPLGNSYVITLNAIECQSGQSLARQQVEAGSKEEVLAAVGEAAVQMRQGLGESLASIEQFDAPIEQASTASLEALKALAAGDDLRITATEEEAIPAYRRALELDPDFAFAHARLGNAYANLRDWENAILHKTRAYELRDEVSERERFYITGHYHTTVTGDMKKLVETYELFKKAYPRVDVARNNLCSEYNEFGWYEKALTECKAAFELDPHHPLHFSNTAQAQRNLGDVAEASRLLDQAFSEGFIRSSLYQERYLTAYLENDRATMDRMVEAMLGKPGESTILNYEAEALAAQGQMQEARRMNRRAIEAARTHGFHERAAYLVATSAMWEATFGNFDEAATLAREAIEIARNRDSMPVAAIAFALAGATAEAEKLIAEMNEQFPENTQIQAVWIPLATAMIEHHAENYEAVLEALEPQVAFERGNLIAIYMRGRAHLGAGRAEEAKTEFKKILEFKGVQPTAPVHSLAQWGLARAYADAGEVAGARLQYESFLDLMKNSDDGLAAVETARDEYPAL